MANEYLQAIRQGVEKTLPSGLVVRLRPIDMGMLLSSDLPEPLMRIVQRHLTGETDSATPTQQAMEDEALTLIQENGAIKTMREMREFGSVIAQQCIVSPKIVENPQTDDQIALREIATGDLMALTQIVGMPLRELIPFRFEQTEDVEPVRAGESDVPVTEPDIQPEPVVEFGTG